MRLILTSFGAALILGFAASASASETRCGWYMNPTPGNLLLIDRDGEWWITSQMQANGPDAIGADDIAPQFDDKEYVQTQPNGYGYGCACLTVTVNTEEKQITRVTAGRIVPLAQCRADKTLPPPQM